MGAPSTPEMHDLLDNFLHSDITQEQPHLVRAVKVLLQASPEYVKPTTLIPTDEVEIRREYAIKIEKRIIQGTPDFKFTAVHLAAVMITPLSNLQRHGYLSDRQPWQQLAHKMNSLACLVKRYLIKKPETPESYAVVEPTTTPDVPERSLSTTSKKRARSVSGKASSRKVRSTKKSEDPDAAYFPPDDGGEDQKELCRERDNNQCVFMHTAKGDCAHIIPRRWNDTEESVEMTRQVIDAARLFLDEDTYLEYENLFADRNNIRTTDKAWNMLYLNKQLHWYLDHASIGMKCLGIEHRADDDTKATVVVQLHWLHRTQYKPSETVTSQGDNNDFNKIVDGLRLFEKQEGPARVEPGGGMFAAVRVNDNVPLVSGHCVRVEMGVEDAEKAKVMFDLAWALGVVAAMSGAADWPNLLPDHEDWDDIKQKAAIQRWVQDQARHRPVDLPSQAPARPPRGLNLPLQAPELPPRSPERMPRSPRTPDRTIWPIGRPPAERSQSPTPLGTITNRPRLDTSPEKSKLLGTPI
ncbi:hypothetical protein FSPOR_185, partial [Fusarium sporotrichioides]